MIHRKMNTIKEITNNALTTRNYLNKYRNIDIACIFCVQIYRYFSNAKLSIVSNNTLCCNVCKIDAMIPITPGTNMYDMDGNERNIYMNRMHYELFEKNNFSDSEYCDYNYEETKKDPLLK